HPRNISRCCVKVEAEALTCFQLDAALSEDADPELRSLKVHQRRYGPAGFSLESADNLQSRAMDVMRAVAEVQPKDIGAGLEQGADALKRRTGRTERCQNFGVAPSPHG